MVETGVQSLTPQGPGVSEKNMLTAAKIALETARGGSTWFGMGGPDQAKINQAEQAYKAQLGNVYASLPGIDTQLKELAAAIAAHPQLSQLNTSDAIQAITNTPELMEQPVVKNALKTWTPASLNQLDRLLSFTRGAGTSGLQIAP
jgi:hypothetical protein